jgi:hypothetical protein
LAIDIATEAINFANALTKDVTDVFSSLDKISIKDKWDFTMAMLLREEIMKKKINLHISLQVKFNIPFSHSVLCKNT